MSAKAKKTSKPEKLKRIPAPRLRPVPPPINATMPIGKPLLTKKVVKKAIGIIEGEITRLIRDYDSAKPFHQAEIERRKNSLLKVKDLLEIE